MEYDMSQERKPKRLLQPGWRNFKIIGCSDEAPSKSSGNKQYIITVQDSLSGYEDKVYAVSEPKKRWVLKEFFDIAGIERGDNGIYKFTPPLSSYLIGKSFQGLVEHQPNDWIDRDGKTHNDFQHRIIDFKKSEEVEWDHDK